MGALFASILAFAFQGSAPEARDAARSADTTPAPAAHAEPRQRRAQRGGRDEQLRSPPRPMLRTRTDAQVRAEQRRAHQLRLVDLRNPFMPTDPRDRYRGPSRPFLVADLRDPFLLATRGRPAWRELPPLPGDIRNPFRPPPPRHPGCDVTTEAPAPAHTRDGVPIQRPRSVRERRIRTRCVTPSQGDPDAPGPRPADLRDPFPRQAHNQRR